MMPEESETHGAEPGIGSQPGGLGHDVPGRRSEGDLLAERRARRAAESGELILTRRAEAAEATVQTLERHVATLQERLLDAEDDLRRTAELLEIEKTAALEREHELRRAKQREYAEQQLRVETEDRIDGLDRESRAESELLSNRLGASEQEARELAARLESLQRQLAEAEHAAAAERAAVRRAEEELRVRLADLERRADEMQRGLEHERLARERSEALLEDMRAGNHRMEGLVGEIKAVVGRLSAAISAGARTEVQPQPAGNEMADALAAAVERLRARAETAPLPEPEPDPEPEPVQEPPVRRPHKHSMSLIGRWRMRRKQRRSQ